MSSELLRHQNIHLINSNTNYIRTENCAYCKYEKRKGYRNIYSRNIFYGNIRPYNYTYYNTPSFNSVQIYTSLKKVNEGTILEINSDSSFCSICQDKIIKYSLIRKINCGHKFHQKCCDKWLEIKKDCPMCRYEL